MSSDLARQRNGDLAGDEARLRQYLEKVTVDLRKARTRIRDLEQRDHEPIAIVGMSCRYPGDANSPDQLWALVEDARDAIGGLPENRGWDLDRLYRQAIVTGAGVQTGGFLAGVADFDPAFFGISPREAESMDPQQRLLLESSWEALEDAELDPRSLQGSDTGVFIGASAGDYGQGSTAAGAAGPHLIGMLASVVSGRIAYTLGLEGPTMTVDTACSSSLVAIHLASQALRGGECSLAIAGGALVMSMPLEMAEAPSIGGGLAPDGRCKSFAEAADGAGFSEGVGVLALARLSDAQREGHPILAVLRGSAVNQDGASYGLAAPNGPAQERVIRQALANARLSPQDVDAVEAHGTGTALGDPIEAGALLATYGQERDEPLRLGSIKSNIGHTAAAAGVAGVIKTVMAMREGLLPKTLHVDRPSSKVDWEAGKVELLTEAEPWEPNGHPRRAGVSSFGVSGTNAHLILEEAPEPAGDRGPKGLGTDSGASSEDAGFGAALPGPIPLALSAKSEPALRAAAGRLRSRLEQHPNLAPVDVGYSLTVTRPGFEHRAVAVGKDREQLLAALDAAAWGIESDRLVRGLASTGRPSALLFPGYGAQWQGMAKGLLEASPVFARKAEECIEAFEPYAEWSLGDILHDVEGTPREQRSDLAALFTMMVSLTELWRSCGVEPSVLVGHSQGEVAAAHVAGGISLEDAALLTIVRTQMLEQLLGQGSMASIAAPAAELESRLGQWEGRLELAAINGPASTIVSGDTEPLEELLAQCEEEGMWARKVPGAVAASHSAQVEALREQLLEKLAGISPRSGEIPFHSTVTGELLDTAELDAEYWYRNLRQTVRLDPVVSSLVEKGYGTLIEVSSHPVLAVSLSETVEAAAADPASVSVISTLRREEGGPERFALSLAEAHAGGAKIEWERFFAGSDAKRVPLPTYPFQRERYWLQSGPTSSDPTAIGQAPAGHPLLGASLSIAGAEQRLLTGRLSLDTSPWLADHVLAGNPLLPASAFVELALRAGREVGCETVEELTLSVPLVLPEKGAVQLQVSLNASEKPDRHEIEIHSRLAQGPDEQPQEWILNASGTLSPQAKGEPERLAAWPPGEAQPLDAEAFYQRLADAGIAYGPALQGIHAAWQDGDEIYAEVSLAEAQAQEAERYTLHPALLAAALHGIDLGAEQAPRLPASFAALTVHRAGASSLRLRLKAEGEGAELLAFDEQGEPLLSIGSVTARELERGELAAARAQRSLYRVQWDKPALLSTEEPSLAILGESHPALPGIQAFPDLASLQEAIAAGATVPEVVLATYPTQRGEDIPAAAHATARGALELAKSWLASEPFKGARLAFLTEIAIAAREGEDPDLATAPLWGLIRSAQSENPGRFALIDLDGSEASLQALPAALRAGSEEPQLALREGEPLAPRLARAQAQEARPQPLDPEQTVLIGGAGELGILIARHLVLEHGARNLLLVGRDPDWAAAEELEELGASISTVSCEVSDRARLEALIAALPAEHPLGAAIHCAAVHEDGVLESLDPERLQGAMRDRLDAAWHLHELSEQMQLSQLVLCSSLSGLIGAPGQANHAAASAFLDALAAHRAAQGLTVASIAWGELSELTGELFDTARALPEPHLVAAELKGTELRAQAEAGLLPSILRDLAPAAAQRPGAALAERLAGAPEEEHEAIALELVRSHVAAVLGHASPNDVDPDRPFQELGFDSLGAVELRNRLSGAGGDVSLVALINEPTAAGVARHLVAQLASPSSVGPSKGGTAFVSLLGQAHETGKLEEYIEMVSAASKLRPTFGESGDEEIPIRAVRFGDGPRSPGLLLITSLTPLSGPQEYVKFAAGFAGERPVAALQAPGFVSGEPLPASVEAAADVLAKSLLDSGWEANTALGGYSSGGWLALAVASRLEAMGAPPAALVLLDSYPPESETLASLAPPLLTALHQAESGGIGLEDTRLTAMAGYMRLFDGWQPSAISTPTIAVRAARSLRDALADDFGDLKTSWDFSHRTVEAPGDHLTMLTEHGAETARAVSAALADCGLETANQEEALATSVAPTSTDQEG